LDLEKLLEQAYDILESTPLESSKNEETTILESLKKKLEPLPNALKYKFLGTSYSLLVIIASDLVDAS
jgi:hypothetical protein